MNLQPKGKSRIPEPDRSKFYNADGWLNAYGLACGYIHEDEKDGISTTLWMEHGAIHVKQYDRNKHERVFWDTYIPSEGPGAYVSARRRFKQALKAAE